MSDEKKGELPVCGVVMKGGISSGVVFPPAIARLADDYRLARIAGTSAGAIAAAAAAAAEYGRRRGVNRFAELGALSKELGAPIAPGGPSRMVSLFQPTPETRRLYAAALASLRPGGAAAKALGVLGALGVVSTLPLGLALALAAAVLATAFVVLPTGSVAIGAGVAAAALAVGIAMASRAEPVSARAPHAALAATGILVAGVAACPLVPGVLGTAVFVGALAFVAALAIVALGGGAALAQRVVEGMEGIEKNRFGMCSGMRPRGADGPVALTEWLHEKFQHFAGLELDEPLTFRHLRDERVDPGKRRVRDEEDADADEAIPTADGIDLRIMTTSLTHGRPYVLPFRTRRFYYDPAELAELLPVPVVHALVSRSEAVIARWREQLEEEGTTPARKRELEERLARIGALAPLLPLIVEDMPVLVAARMSLSFPGLVSAFPLWSLDYTRPENQAAREALRKREAASFVAERVWFSDGGICSNFPVHLFDDPIPRWPVFGIDLQYLPDKPPEDERIGLIERYADGLSEDWNRLGGARDGGSSSPTGGVGMGGFLGGILHTMQNWSDNVMLPAPGFRDRIVHVRLGPNEGGVNLEMKAEDVTLLGNLGHEAAHALANRFQAPAAHGRLGWDAHRWSRFRATMAIVERTVDAMLAAYDGPDTQGGRSYEALLTRGTEVAPTSYAVSQERGVRAQRFFATLRALRRRWADARHDPRFRDGAPQPETELHVRPRL